MEKKPYVEPSLTVVTVHAEQGYGSSILGVFDNQSIMFDIDHEEGDAAVSSFSHDNSWSEASDWH